MTSMNDRKRGAAAVGWLIFIVIILIAWGATWGWKSIECGRQVKGRTTELAQDTAHAIAVFGSKQIIAGNWGDLQSFADDLVKEKPLAYVAIVNTKGVVFVSTNSITQGEQVAILWNTLFQRYHVKIHFAHRTFRWESEARGKAHVHVVIIGFGAFDNNNKVIFDYDGQSEAAGTAVSNISAYLTEGSDQVILPRSQPISAVPACQYGSKPADGGHLIIEEEDRQSFLDRNPGAERYLRPLLCAEQYLHGQRRWCLWLEGISPHELRLTPEVLKRVEAVREFRLASKKEPTRDKADVPTLFAEIRQPAGDFIIVPQHTSETRKYIPFGYFGPESIVHNSCSFVPNASLFHFGVLSSAMHMAWVKQLCGRIKSDYRYSTRLVYNNFPWPTGVTEKRIHAVQTAATHVLMARGLYPDSSPADLYDPNTMPLELSKAHAELDRAVDKCYRSETFHGDRQRMEYLLWRYREITEPMAVSMEPKKRIRRTRSS